MGFLDQFMKTLKREGADAKDWLSDGIKSANSWFDKAERRQSSDPAEAIKQLQEDAEENDSLFERIRERATGRSAKSEAGAPNPIEVEVVDIERTRRDEQ